MDELNILDLPDEIIYLISKYLDYSTLLSLTLTCSKLSESILLMRRTKLLLKDEHPKTKLKCNPNEIEFFMDSRRQYQHLAVEFVHGTWNYLPLIRRFIGSIRTISIASRWGCLTKSYRVQDILGIFNFLPNIEEIFIHISPSGSLFYDENSLLGIPKLKNLKKLKINGVLEESENILRHELLELGWFSNLANITPFHYKDGNELTQLLKRHNGKIYELELTQNDDVLSCCEVELKYVRKLKCAVPDESKMCKFMEQLESLESWHSYIITGRIIRAICRNLTNLSYLKFCIKEQLDDNTLDAINNLKNLKELNLTMEAECDVFFGNYFKLEELKRLEFFSKNLSEQNVIGLCVSCPNLTELVLSYLHGNITCKSMTSICQNLKHLKSLTLLFAYDYEYEGDVLVDGLNDLHLLNNLISLTLVNINIPASALLRAHHFGLHNLELHNLNLQIDNSLWTNITENFPNLTKLSLMISNVNDKAVKSMAKNLKNLQYLNISCKFHAGLSEASTKHVMKYCKNLKQLRIVY